MVVPECERLKVRQHEEEIDLDYRSSRLSFEPDEAFVSGPHAGARAPDAAHLRIAGKASTLLEALQSPHQHLLLFSSSKTSDAEPDLITATQWTLNAHGQWLKVHVVGSNKCEPQLPAGATLIEDPQGELRLRYGGDLARLYLIRPDGYVA